MNSSKLQSSKSWLISSSGFSQANLSLAVHRLSWRSRSAISRATSSRLLSQSCRWIVAIMRVLVEAAAGAVAGYVVEVAVLEAFAGSFAEVGGVFVAATLFAGGEGAGFGAGDLLVGGHAFEEELGCGDGDFDRGARVDLQRREFVEEALDGMELGEDGLRGLLVVEFDGAAEVEPLLDLLGVGVGEVGVVDVGDGLADELADDDVGTLHLAFVLELDLAGDAGEGGEDVADARDDERPAVDLATTFDV